MSSTVDIPELTSKDIKAIFENMDIYLNQILLEAFLDSVSSMDEYRISLCCRTVYGNLGHHTVEYFFSQALPGGTMKNNNDLGHHIPVCYGHNCLVNPLVASELCIHKEWMEFWAVFLGFQNMGSSFLQILLTVEISGIAATMITDAIMFGINDGLLYFSPFCAPSSQQVMYIYHYVEDVVSLQATTSYNGYTVWVILYLSLVLSTTILSTVLIIYWMIKVILCTKHGRVGIQSYRGTIEILVESTFLYSVALTLYIIFISRKTLTAQYLDTVTGVIRAEWQQVRPNPMTPGVKVLFLRFALEIIQGTMVICQAYIVKAAQRSNTSEVLLMTVIKTMWIKKVLPELQATRVNLNKLKEELSRDGTAPIPKTYFSLTSHPSMMHSYILSPTLLMFFIFIKSDFFDYTHDTEWKLLEVEREYDDRGVRSIEMHVYGD
ncbi:hypothetical protein EDD85DRAFT_796855 [Armillaria nabsnona]|nr:hypothetical protein EDD85DRAFT_796855 [Armillaria nabsnona]